MKSGVSKALLIVDGATVLDLLSLPLCIEAMRRAMIDVSKGMIDQPLRAFLSVPEGAGQFGIMPAIANQVAVYGAKLLSLHPANAQRGLPVIQGLVAVFDAETGAPIAIIDAAALTGVRTAAASALATDVLALPDARSHAIFGAGTQAQFHFHSVLAVRPQLRTTMIWARDAEKAKKAAAALSAQSGRDVRAVTDAQEAGACDIITTVTHSPTPILEGAWLRSGCHVNLVGAHHPAHREADSRLISHARVFVDSRLSARHEAGDLLIPMAEGVFTEGQIIAEIGEVAAGITPGRLHADDITVYKSLGIGAQDLYAAAALLEALGREKRGVHVPF